MKTTYETLNVTSDEGILTITINRPNALNALNQTVLTELKEVLSELNTREFKYHGVILAGAGERAFIAGADIKAMDEMDKGTADKFCRLGQEVSLLFEQIPLPVIACVHGFALGGGCEMAMSCDFIYASKAPSLVNLKSISV